MISAGGRALPVLNSQPDRYRIAESSEWSRYMGIVQCKGGRVMRVEPGDQVLSVRYRRRNADFPWLTGPKRDRLDIISPTHKR